MIKVLRNALVFAAIIASAFTVHAQVSLEEISLKEKVDNSSLIIEGKVIAKKCFWDSDRRLIYTANTVQVYKVFKGEPVETVDVLTLGGVVGLRALHASHFLQLGVGSTGVFTLYDSNIIAENPNEILNKQYRAYSSLQGYYKYDLQNDVVLNTFSKQKGIKNKFYQDLTLLTKKNYVELMAFDVERVVKNSALKKSNLLPPSGITFTPTTITAGTNSVLTINGTGFGTVQGKVGFRNADAGGSTFVDALDDHVLTWTDTQITVEVPSISSNDASIDGTAGTGVIRVTDSNGMSALSSSILTVSYAQINVSFDLGGGNGLETFQVQHFDDNGSGGYTWEMQEQFFDDSEHPGARAAFERAFDSWRCETKINWVISGSFTTVDDISTAEHVIRFDNGSELPAGVLGTAFSGYSGRGCPGGVIWWVRSLDIVFDSERNWYFGASGETFNFGEFDFETVALHELGHAHQLGHVINPANVMHFQLSSNTSSNVLDSNSIAGANDVHSRSTGNQICDVVPSNPKPLMTDYAGSCSLSNEENELEKNISIYPNPVKQNISIKNTSFIELKSAILYDLSGRSVVEHDISNSSKLKSIDVSGISSGVYFIKIASNQASITRKLVVE